MYGVDVFFVISGFILPWSMWRAGYQVNAGNVRRFVWKRLIRIEPPYVATVLLVVNPLFWTLAVECQFYLLIAVVYPLIESPRRGTRLGLMLDDPSAGGGILAPC